MYPVVDEGHQVANSPRPVERDQREVALPTVERFELKHDEHEIERLQPQLVEADGVLDRRVGDVQLRSDEVVNERLSIHDVTLLFFPGYEEQQ
jgi:hypothetical protein